MKNLKIRNDYRAYYFNFYILSDPPEFCRKYTHYKYNIIFGTNTGYSHPPASREELKGLADFIYDTIGEKK